MSKKRAKRRKTRPRRDSSAALPEYLFKIPGYDPTRDAKGYEFDAKEAKLALDFFPEMLKLIEGAKAGEPFALELWQRSIIGNLFGWKSKRTGLRRYRETFIFVPRKNGKTPLAAGLVLLVGFHDNEPGAQIYAAAAEREQAGLVFRHAAGMVAREPELDRRARIYKSFKSMELPQNGIFKALSADADTKHGFNSHCVVIDELHAHKTRDLVDVLLTSTGSRRQPLVVYITTAGYDRESICYEKYEYARGVRDGSIKDPSFLPVIYEAGEKEDWKAESTWRKANPNLGVSVSLEYLKRECQRAIDVPSYENTFKRLHLNIWTEQDIRWLQMEAWDGCPGTDESTLEGKECFAGLDLSSTRDLTAFVGVFQMENGIKLKAWFWIPEDTLRSRKEAERLRQWVKAGWIQTTPGNVIDYDRVRADINSLKERFNIREIAIDRWNSTQLQTQLVGDGFNVVPYGQGYASMSAPTKEFEKLVMGRKLDHGGNPVMRWMASNTAAEQDEAGNLKPSKAKSSEKIDGIVAAVMGLGRLLVSDNSGDSVYETRGILTL